MGAGGENRGDHGQGGGGTGVYEEAGGDNGGINEIMAVAEESNCGGARRCRATGYSNKKMRIISFLRL